MRGKPRSVWPMVTTGGNIPAYAGKTPEYAVIRKMYSEHPRVCGENLTAGHGFQIQVGTSPRMRGKRVPCMCQQPDLKEHPRVCGENGSKASIRDFIRGTSPRMRGKRVCSP